jgi:hypothetical protein
MSCGLLFFEYNAMLAPDTCKVVAIRKAENLPPVFRDSTPRSRLTIDLIQAGTFAKWSWIQSQQPSPFCNIANRTLWMEHCLESISTDETATDRSKLTLLAPRAAEGETVLLALQLHLTRDSFQSLRLSLKLAVSELSYANSQQPIVWLASEASMA